METTEEALLSLILAGSIGVGVVAGIVSLSVACGVASGCCALVGALLALRSASDRQVASMREAVPDALRAMIVCFRSGLSLLQTLQHASQEVGGSLGRLLGIAAKRLEVGEPPARALAALSEYKHIPELAFVAVALDVQHQSGGSIVAVLESACESVEGELELMRSLRVQTAQAKLSARIVTVMPFVLIALFSLISSDFLEPFFSSFAGMCLLGVALLMQAAGVLLVRRMLKVETA